MVPFPVFLCGANDGTRTRCLHLGRVTLRLLSFIRSVLPGCSLFACLRWGLERMTGLEPAASTLARWRSDLLSYIRSVRQPLLAWAREDGRLFVSFVYECTRGALFLSTPHCCNIGHTLVLVRTVSVNPVPYAPGPSSPCAVRRGSCVWLPSIMTKMVYCSHPSLMSFSLRVYSTRAFMMRAHLLPRTSARVIWYRRIKQGCVTYFCRLRFLV